MLQHLEKSQRRDVDLLRCVRLGCCLRIALVHPAHAAEAAQATHSHIEHLKII